jgi:hypothetical protein
MSCSKLCRLHVENGGQCLGLISSNGWSTWYTPIFADSPVEWYEDAFQPYFDGEEIYCNGYTPLQ